MKKINRIIIILSISITSIFSFFSCSSYLDVDQYFNDMLTLDSAFTKRVYVDGWLSNAYQHLQQDCGENEGNFKYASDDLFTYSDNSKKYQNGNYSAQNQLLEDKDKDNNGNDFLGRLYEAVRKSSTFIQNVDNCEEMTLSEKADYKAQARFLRAYAYWALIRRYGPVPLLPDKGLEVSLSYEELSIPRANFDEIINFINNDLVLAATSLPLTRPQNNLGRPNRGAALGLRARVLLHAASPLYNGNVELFDVKDKRGNQLIPQVYDESKWARAAAAAKDVIDLNKYELLLIDAKDIVASSGVKPPYHAVYSNANYPNGWADIDPYSSYKSNFDGTVQANQNNELVFTRTFVKNTITDFAKDCVPLTLKGNNKIAVSQKQVDTYYTRDGLDINDVSSGYQKLGFTTTSTDYDFVPTDVSLQYVNREPRFYASIAFSGSIWQNESASETQYKNFQVFYYRNENDGKLGFKEEFPLSGIGFRKYYNKEDAYTTGGYQMSKPEPTIRYAEILLIYAEALNELTGSYQMTDYVGNEVTIDRNVIEIQSALKRIRMRAGIPDFSSDIYNSQSNLRAKLKRERQIEFVGENAMRYTDLRRWKDADVEENAPLMGCNINISKDNLKIQEFYVSTVIVSVPKSFSRKMYLWPFPTAELKRNVNLTQNPGW